MIVTGLERSGLAFRATEVGALDVLSEATARRRRALGARPSNASSAALSALSEVKLIGHAPAQLLARGERRHASAALR